ncbi:CLUMA_CG019362, isoform A [Clunio marinus]|uniref:CLUMA_CG019362, isoform A n=1 Tax=Clunio marinus TaxID=568069 RepID=A0A1J1J680_9DIPT|nr:CLUMA_CG019362, isoform A [Clunio marinus]
MTEESPRIIALMEFMVPQIMSCNEPESENSHKTERAAFMDIYRSMLYKKGSKFDLLKPYFYGFLTLCNLTIGKKNPER